MRRAFLVAVILGLLVGGSALAAQAADTEQTGQEVSTFDAPEILSCEDQCRDDFEACRLGCPHKQPYWEICVNACWDDYDDCLAGC